MVKQQRTKAFTLVEMLIVMAIIGLLSIGAIAGGSYAIRQGRVSRKIKNVDQLAALLQAHYNENLAYPEGTNTTQYPMTPVTNLIATYGEGFIFNGEPCSKDNANHTCYRYGTAGGTNPSTYALCVGLEDAGKANVEYTGSATGHKGCYCTGGNSSIYSAVCNRTTER